MIDLTVVSVLLDAGAGAGLALPRGRHWQRFTRSEGLGVASWHAFAAGLFSSDPAHPLRVDAAGAAQSDRASGWPRRSRFARESAGRTRRPGALLRRLGDALASQPEVFGAGGRPGGLFDSTGSHTESPRTTSCRSC